MEVYRLTRRKYADRLSGIGAALHGARWNSQGVELVYTAANRSLAMAGVSVHFTLATLPEDYQMLTIFVPDDIAVQRVELASLPTAWNAFPHRASTKVIGDAFAQSGRYGLIQVPSAVTQGDYNYLINPHHPAFVRIKIVETQAFPFDSRLFE